MTLRARAPFIWTSKQPIDALGFLSAMQNKPLRQDGVNRWFLFRRLFDVQDIATDIPLHVTVDGRYQLFINGCFIGRGPVRCDPLHQKYDTYDISSYLRVGQNSIGLIVHSFGVDTSWYEAVKGMWHSTFGDGGVWITSDIVSTDLAWRCLECAAWAQDMPRVNHSIGFIESFDARHFPSDWLQIKFDDTGWDTVHELSVGDGGPESFFGGIATRPFPLLFPSGIPALVEESIQPKHLVWVKSVVPNPTLSIDKRVYREELFNQTPSPLTPALDKQSFVIRTTTTNDAALLFDFGSIHTAYPFFDIEAQGGEIIEIAVSESLPGEWDIAGPATDARITPRPMLGADAHVTRYVAKQGRQRFQRFEWQAVKWLQITVRNAPGGVIFYDVGITQTHYPVEAVGEFSSSDEDLNKLWQVGAHTLKLCMHDGWEDCPSREQRQWLGDATVEHLIGQVAFGPSVNCLNAKYLKDIAASQRPDGLTQMFAPGDHATNGILIPDWTLQWILNARNHLSWSGDSDTIEAIFPNIQRALAWFEAQLNINHLVNNMPYWHFMDWAGVGRHAQACALNAQLAGCFWAASEMAETLENKRVSSHYAQRAQNIQSSLNRLHWDERRGIYVDCVNAESSLQELRVSQHSNAAMILWGNAPPERWPRMIQRISNVRRLKFTAAPPIAPTGEILDTEHDIVMANTFYSHFVNQAFVKAGRVDLMLANLRDRFGKMIARGATTFWESFEPTASLCHGFSATPTYQLTTGICGVSPAHNGFTSMRFAPNIVDLESVQAKLGTVLGVISVSLQRHSTGFFAELALPHEMKIDVVAPLGYTAQLLTAGRYNFEHK
jgi:alpha-L-rhamnosidase